MRSPKLKWAILLVFAVLIGAYFLFGWGRYFNLEELRSHKESLVLFYRAHPLATIAVYFGLYVLVTGLSLPAATVLTLAGGALFGFWTGTILVSFASTLGATCAFSLARFLLGDLVRARFPEALARARRDFERDGGSFYLLTLRLLPVFPFFIVNLVMALLPIRTLTFFFVSQIGMLPATLVYVNAGTQLASIHSVRDIASFRVLASLTLLGLAPLATQAILGVARRRRVYRGYKRPRRADYNVIVIGGGAAGLVTAYIASALRAKVALVEKRRMGGDCLNTGCVPSKALIRSSRFLREIRSARKLGFRDARADFGFAELMDRVQETIRRIEPHDSVERYEKLGVDCVSGEARVVSPFEVEVSGRKLTARNLVIATGAEPFVPEIPGLREVGYLTSESIWSIRELPKRLLVLGAGPIGCELGQAFASLGSEVTLVDQSDRILQREDTDAAAFLTERLRAEGMRLLLSRSARRFEKSAGSNRLICDSGHGEAAVEFDQMLLALGRRARVRGFGLEELGIEVAPGGTVAHDGFLRTRFPNIYVCGDVAGPVQLTHAASHQAWYASVNALFSPLKRFRYDDRVLPRVTFTDPELAQVGQTEADAKARGVSYEVTRYELAELDRAVTESSADGFVKVLTAPGSDRILGATVIGDRAGEIIMEFTLGMRHRLGLNQILGTIHPYPTFSEAARAAAGEWKKAHAPERALRFLARFHAWRRS